MGWQADLDEYYDHAGAAAVPWNVSPPDPTIAAWHDWWRHRATDATDDQLVHAVSQSAAASRSARRHAVATGRWTAAGRGMVAYFDVRDADPFVQAARTHAVRAVGASVRNPALVVCGRSAAVLHGLPLKSAPTLVEVTRRGRQRAGPRAGHAVSRARLLDAEVAHWWGAAVTTVARTLVDLARRDAEEAIIAADAVLRARLVTPPELARALDAAAGWPEVRRAREVLELASGAAESPLESLTRLVLHDAGFPPPRLQWRVEPYVVDFAWPELGLVLEADGVLKYLGERGDAQRTKEKHREQALRRAGYRVERVTWRELTRDRARTLAYLREVFRAQGAELPA